MVRDGVRVHLDLRLGHRHRAGVQGELRVRAPVADVERRVGEVERAAVDRQRGLGVQNEVGPVVTDRDLGGGQRGAFADREAAALHEVVAPSDVDVVDVERRIEERHVHRHVRGVRDADVVAADVRAGERAAFAEIHARVPRWTGHGEAAGRGQASHAGVGEAAGHPERAADGVSVDDVAARLRERGPFGDGDRAVDGRRIAARRAVFVADPVVARLRPDGDARRIRRRCVGRQGTAPQPDALVEVPGGGWAFHAEGAAVRDDDGPEVHGRVHDAEVRRVLHGERLARAGDRTAVAREPRKVPAHVETPRAAHRGVVVQYNVTEGVVGDVGVVHDRAASVNAVAGYVDELLARHLGAADVGRGIGAVVDVKRRAGRNHDGRGVCRPAERPGEVRPHLEHAVRDEDGLRAETARRVERERARAGLGDRARPAEPARAGQRHVAVRGDQDVVRVHVGRQGDRPRVRHRRVRVRRERHLLAGRVRPGRHRVGPDGLARGMPEEVRRGIAARRGREGKDAAGNRKRAAHAGGEDRGELRLVTRGHAAEDRSGDAVHEAEVRHVHRHRPVARQHERVAGGVEVRVLHGLQDCARLKRERDRNGHHHRVRERGAAFHRERAVAHAARALDRHLPFPHDRAAGMFLLESLHDHLARTLLHEHAGTCAGQRVKRDGVSRRVDRERITVQMEPPVAGIKRVVLSDGLVDRHVGLGRQP